MKPKLLIQESYVEDIVKKLMNEETIVLTDKYNFPKLKKLRNVVLIESSSQALAKKLSTKKFKNIVAVGGCTCLDVARSVAKNKNLYIIPTILSTSCISNNYSILSVKRKNRILKTKAPNKVIIPLLEISSSKKKDILNWSSSGVGDQIANISASIDLHFRKKQLNTKKILQNAKEAVKLVKSFTKDFKGFDKKHLMLLAKSIHNSGLEVIKKRSLELSSGSEHKLYHDMVFQNKHYKTNKQTHGKIVYIGALLNAKVYGIVTGDYSIFNLIETVGKQLKLPTNKNALHKIGITKKQIKKSLINVQDYKGLLTSYVKQNGVSIVDEVFT